MMLDIHALHFSYDDRAVLQGVDLHLGEGELVFLLGGNGAGKTTLFRCISGLLKPSQGEILLDGKPLSSLSARERAKLIAYIPQINRPVFAYSVLDMVLMGTSHRLGALASPGSAERHIALDALARLGMEDFASRSYAQLSGGEQQLVLIARALAQQSKVLLMDEPTSALDYGNQLKVLDQAASLAQQGYTILLSCHNPQLALLYARRIAALHEGRIIADGEGEDVLTPQCLSTLYGVAARFVRTEKGTFISPQRKTLSCWTQDMVDFMADAAKINRFHAALADAMLPFLPVGGSFCDAGCGIGSLALAMAPHFKSVVAADINVRALNALRAQNPPENVEVRCCDILRGTQPEFDVMAFCFFGSAGEILQAAARQCRGVIAIITRTWNEHRFTLSQEGAPLRRENRLLQELQERSIPYDCRELTFDMGQPFRTIDDALRFFRTYDRNDSARALTAGEVRERLTVREDAEFPWYFPLERTVSLVLIRAKDLPDADRSAKKENLP